MESFVFIWTLRLITSTQQATTKTSIISGNCAICMPTLSINIQVIVGVCISNILRCRTKALPAWVTASDTPIRLVIAGTKTIILLSSGTSDAKNVDDYISRDNLFANANSTWKPLLLSCSAPSHPHHLLLGFTVIMWLAAVLLLMKWHCFTLKRMRFLREDEDFNPAFWNHNGTSEYDQIPLEHRKLFYNWNRVKSKEDDWVYSNTREQQDLLNNLNNELA